MVEQMLRRVGLLLALFLFLVAAPVHAAEPRIVAIGDLHGDHQVWRDIARAAGVIDARGRWTGGTTVLIQAGDVSDRGPGTLNIIRDLMRLQREAAAAGGRVVALVGNHEAMNMIGDLRYVDPGEYEAFVSRQSAAKRNAAYQLNRAAIEARYKAANPAMTPDQIRQRWLAATPLGWVEHRTAWRPDGEIGRWMVTNPAVALVGGTLFVHGGLSAEYSTRSIDDINRQVAAALRSMDENPKSIISDPLGPLWYRGLVSRDPRVTEIPPTPPNVPPRPAIEQELDIVLRAYKAKRIAIAHTPIKSGIEVLHGGRLIRIDTGNSRYYEGTPSYLEIVGDQLTGHKVARSSDRGRVR